MNVSPTKIAKLNVREHKTSYSILSNVANRQTQHYQKHHDLRIRMSMNGGLIPSEVKNSTLIKNEGAIISLHTLTQRPTFANVQYMVPQNWLNDVLSKARQTQSLVLQNFITEHLDHEN